MTAHDHRLAREAHRSARNYRVSAVAAAAGAALKLGEWVSAGGHELPGQALALLAAAPFSALLAYRWSRRAHWYASTESWWLHLEDAPSILPLPALAEWLDRPMSWRTVAIVAVVCVAGIAASVLLS